MEWINPRTKIKYFLVEKRDIESHINQSVDLSKTNS